MVAKLGKEPPNNKYQKNASNGKTLPTIAVSLWSTWGEAHEKEFFFGRNTDFRSTCMLLQSGARASKAMSWTTLDNFVLERKKGTFRRNPRRTKLLFHACKTLDFPLLKWPFQGICTRFFFQKYKNVKNTTVSGNSLIVLALCDVITDTAYYRCCYLVFNSYWSSPEKPLNQHQTRFLARWYSCFGIEMSCLRGGFSTKPGDVCLFVCWESYCHLYC